MIATWPTTNIHTLVVNPSHTAGSESHINSKSKKDLWTVGQFSLRPMAKMATAKKTTVETNAISAPRAPSWAK